MERWSADEAGIAAAVRALKSGLLVGMPTETVYGLAGNALDSAVVASIFEAKGRPTFDPLIVHAASVEEAFSLVREVPAAARHLADQFWPGPLTLVLPRRAGLPDLLSAGLDTLAIRVPAHPTALRLLKQSGMVLAAPSANRFGCISPTEAGHVMEELGGEEAVAGVLDAGPCQQGVESTVVGFPSPDRVVVYRLGATPLEELREAVDGVEWVPPQHRMDDDAVAEHSPGMLARHYAPHTRLLLLKRGEVPPEYLEGRIGWLGFQSVPDREGPKEILSERGDLTEAATRLFRCLRSLDREQVDTLVVWEVPDEGLGKAINDRLARASFPVS